MADFSSRKREAESRLVELKHMHGIAMLDGKPFDLAEMADVERELSGLEAAEGEAVRRERLEAAKTEEARLEGLRQTLIVVEEHRLEAADRAEKAARDVAEALKEFRLRSADAARLLRALGVNNVLALDETDHRMSWRLTAALKPLVGHVRRFGQIVFPEARSPYDQPWRAEEQAIAGRYISKALKGDMQ
ncbi:hypothetical protein NLY43_31415 [Mesorhizobium sp. C416B]|uniref:hypothetical protein n=1 Tax=unclassified Mesorhizobium TaxID=325217 RepID=UPI0012EB8E36|nr:MULTISPECIES: hypothetical protein [unclassified Mesorhizobium]WJI63028.1 hypothetical protein NLY43_31415 [Mesorhizobium sp. C416B]